MTVVEISTIAQNVIMAIAGIIGSIVAILGYRQWLEQLKGADKYAAGKKVIFALVNFKDAVDQVRNPFMSMAEFQYSDTEEANYYQDKQIQAKGLERAYNARLKILYEARKNLVIAIKECEVIKGIGYAEEISPLIKIFAEIVVAVKMHVKEESRGRFMREMSDSEKKWQKEQFDKLYEGGENDETSKQLAEEIAILERKIREDFLL